MTIKINKISKIFFRSPTIPSSAPGPLSIVIHPSIAFPEP